jgi:di/tricarboxylate transporter
LSFATWLPMVRAMSTTTRVSSASSGIAATARRYDAAIAKSAAPAARPAVTHVASDLAETTTLAPAAYSANAAISRTPDEARGSLVDLLA